MNKKIVYALMILIVINLASATTLYNSYTDWSGQQGNNSVRYGCYDRSLDILRTVAYSTPNSRWYYAPENANTCNMNKLGSGTSGTNGGGGQPNFYVNWSVEQAGTYNISFSFKKVYNSCADSADGMNVTISKNTFTNRLYNRYVLCSDNARHNESVLADLTTDDKLIYVIYANANSFWDSYNATRFYAEFLYPFNFVITSAVTNFSANINGTIYTTTNGTINTPLILSDGLVFNITVFSLDYVTQTFLNYNTSTNLQVNLTPTISYLTTANNQVLETSEQTFTINFTHTNNISDINAHLIWNGTKYTATKVNESTTKKFFTKTITMPDLNTNTVISYYWNYTYTRADTTTKTLNTTHYNQTIQAINLYNCTSGNRTDEFIILNEETPSNKLTADFSMIVNYWTSNPNNKLNFSFGDSGKSNYSICLNSNGTVQSNIYITYTTTNGFTHRYYFVNYTLNNTLTTTNNLYNFNHTTSVSELRGNLKNQNDFVDYSGVYAVLQRLYVAEDTWRTVQMDRSGDFGNINFNIIENNIDYRMLFYDENYNLLRQTDQLKFSCTSGLCELTILLDPAGATSVSANISVNTLFNNATRIYTINWSDPTSRTSAVHLIVTKEFYDRATTICDTTVVGSAGNISCNLTGYTGNIQARVYSSASPFKPVLFEVVELVRELLGNAFNDRVQQAFWGFMIILGSVGVGMFSPAAAIIGLTIGVVMVYWTGVMPLITYGIAVVIATVLMVAGYLLKD